MYHPARTSLRELLEKRFRYGRGQAHLHRHYPERFETRNPLDPRNYLPLRPSVFRSRLRNAEISLSPSESVIVYLIAHLSKLASSAGSVYERFGSRPTIDCFGAVLSVWGVDNCRDNRWPVRTLLAPSPHSFDGNNRSRGYRRRDCVHE
jgi:hypothetical protein